MCYLLYMSEVEDEWKTFIALCECRSWGWKCIRLENMVFAVVLKDERPYIRCCFSRLVQKCKQGRPCWIVEIRNLIVNAIIVCHSRKQQPYCVKCAYIIHQCPVSGVIICPLIIIMRTEVFLWYIRYFRTSTESSNLSQSVMDLSEGQKVFNHPCF